MKSVYLLIWNVICMILGFSSVALASVRNGKNCGAECLYIVTRTLNAEKSPRNLDELLKRLGPAHAGGYSLRELADQATKLGFVAEPRNINLETLKQAVSMYSVILHLKPGHYVLCSSVVDQGVFVFDPEKRLGTLPIQKLTEMWDGNCIVISETPIVLNIPSKRTGNQVALFVLSILSISLLVLFLFWRTRRLR
jgi:ABC-type bacteriocin/lantibiotic exporter with double-glycine peptidase domain